MSACTPPLSPLIPPFHSPSPCRHLHCTLHHGDKQVKDSFDFRPLPVPLPIPSRRVKFLFLRIHENNEWIVLRPNQSSRQSSPLYRSLSSSWREEKHAQLDTSLPLPLRIHLATLTRSVTSLPSIIYALQNTPSPVNYTVREKQDLWWSVMICSRLESFQLVVYYLKHTSEMWSVFTVGLLVGLIISKVTDGTFDFSDNDDENDSYVLAIQGFGSTKRIPKTIAHSAGILQLYCIQFCHHFIIIITHPLTVHHRSCSPLPSGTCELQACSFPGVVFPPPPLSALSSSPSHCTLQDGFGQTWWTGDMTIPLQIASLYGSQEVFVWSDCLLDLGTEFPSW